MTARVTTKILEQALKERLDAVETEGVEMLLNVKVHRKYLLIMPFKLCQVVSERFYNMNILARHRLVNTVLKEEINKLHAFSQEDYTPEEWSKLRQNVPSKS
ncbi:uncharacterized protein T551_01586 [Pneumocystis jirovecii RU7]|uniref:BolA-like protein 2 n=1 Tax=Pneumocystis jirovecii (strain RU7) TaxID=1408657 RepID=A0A0W4ZRN2_PNEJ7|nr:uncharacterized protein T551_01586 [Pneumocystis jirovecii RU7]KTW31034.1 hypothetical protein T551_01586 [Pneumocystis jirovecii RU7]